MFRDDDLYPTATRMASPLHDQEEVDGRLLIGGNANEDNHVNDDLDSIFGSEPSSPILSPVDTELSASQPNTQNGDTRRREAEISDIPRLREKHETEGYRDGVTEGKAKFIQDGFDEGYTLGAVLGLKVGKVLGLLEGIAGALSTSDHAEEKTDVEGLWKDAMSDLKTERVFAREFWDEEGIWKWSVPGDGEGSGEVVFEDVVKAHPLLQKWEGVVDDLIKKYGIDLNIWEGAEGDEEGVVRMQGVKVVGETKEEVVPAAGKILGVQREKLNW